MFLLNSLRVLVAWEQFRSCHALGGAPSSAGNPSTLRKPLFPVSSRKTESRSILTAAPIIILQRLTLRLSFTWLTWYMHTKRPAVSELTWRC